MLMTIVTVQVSHAQWASFPEELELKVGETKAVTVEYGGGYTDHTFAPNNSNYAIDVKISGRTAYVTGLREGTGYIQLNVWRWLSGSTEKEYVHFLCYVTVTSPPGIQFADAKVKALCVANWDTNGDGGLSEAEAAAVTDLGEVFNGNKEITSFNELQYFTGLTSFEYPCGFTDCTNLTSITIPSSVKKIYSGFEGCGFTSITIPNSVTEIRPVSFCECHNLKSVTIGSGMTNYESNVFQGCNNLTSIVVASGNSKYDSRNNCNAVIETASNTLIEGCKNTTIPSSVTNIGEYAFVDKGLTSVTIPESVTSIDHSAFGQNYDLTDVFCYARNVPSTSWEVFDDETIASATLHVPASSIQQYQTTEPWSKFGSIVSIDGDEPGDSDTELVTIGEGNVDGSFNTVPYNNYYKYSTTQMLYTPREIGRSGTIKSIAFKVANATSHSTSEVKVYLGHKSDLFSGTTDYVSSNLTLVYSGAPTLGRATGWEKLDFNQGEFEYNGTDNLVVVVTRQASSYTKSLTYDCYSGTGYVLYRRSDEDTSCADVTNTSKGYSDYNERPVVKLELEGNTSDGPDTDISQLDNIIYLEKTESLAGSNVTLPFQMKNSAAIRGFQFDLYLPDGVTAVKNAKGRIQGALSSGRLPEDDEHTLTIQEQPDGAIRFLCNSLYDETFTGSDGEIATLQIKIADNMEDGDYPIVIKNMKLTETNISNFYETDYLKSTLSITSYMLGDVNSDTMIDILDYTGVANHIVGIAQDVFVEKAADVDNSGQIDVADYTGIANLIMTGNVYGTSNNVKPESGRRKAADYGDNYIIVQDTSMPITDARGAEVELSLCMKNSAPIRGFQFDMYLPEGFTVVKNAKGRISASLTRARLADDDEHTLTVQEQADGAIRFLCSSLYDETFSGSDGEIATVKVKIAENIAAGNYRILLRNMKLTETNISNYYEADNVESVFIVASGNGIAELALQNVSIQAQGGSITVEGAADGTAISVYSSDGMLQGTAVADKGIATLSTSLQAGSIAFVKVGEKTVKVLMK